MLCAQLAAKEHEGWHCSAVAGPATRIGHGGAWEWIPDAAENRAVECADTAASGSVGQWIAEVGSPLIRRHPT